MDRLRSALAGAGTVGRGVALPVVRGLEAFATGEYAQGAATLAACRSDAWRLGGSPLQREIIDLTLAAASARGAGRQFERAAAA